MWGPCACPGWDGSRNADSIALARGQAQGPRPSPHPPLVPTRCEAPPSFPPIRWHNSSGRGRDAVIRSAKFISDGEIVSTIHRFWSVKSLEVTFCSSISVSQLASLLYDIYRTDFSCERITAMTTQSLEITLVVNDQPYQSTVGPQEI